MLKGYSLDPPRISEVHAEMLLDPPVPRFSRVRPYLAVILDANMLADPTSGGLALALGTAFLAAEVGDGFLVGERPVDLLSPGEVTLLVGGRRLAGYPLDLSGNFGDALSLLKGSVADLAPGQIVLFRLGEARETPQACAGPLELFGPGNSYLTAEITP
jgi:hypothetical protein